MLENLCFVLSRFLREFDFLTTGFKILWIAFLIFYVLLIVHLDIIHVNSQPGAQCFFVYVYFSSLHVSSNHMHIIRRINSINTTSGICHSV